MLHSLPAHFRSYKLPADVRTLLLLRKAIDRGLVHTFGDLFGVLKNILVKAPKQLGPFTRAYYSYFLAIEIQAGDRLEDAIRRSETFQRWKKNYLDEADRDVDLDLTELVNRFLDEVHLTQYDIKEVLDGRELFDEDDPELEDDDGVPDQSNDEPHYLDKMADYSDLSMEEILERLKKIREQQRGHHRGGSHWVGTGGISPYGHGGAAKNGIRVGGTGGGRMARKVIGDRNFFPVDRDALINDNNVDAALAAIKGVVEEQAQEQLDVEGTIKKGLQRGGLFLPELRYQKEEKLQVIVLIDNGGYSMSPYVRTVQQLFKKMKTRFAHDLEVFYFHNTIYDVVYKDARRTKPFPVARLTKYDKNYRVFIIGDAAMAPYELDGSSIRQIKGITEQFKRTVWLNPEPEKYWPHTYTIQAIKSLVEMYPLTPRGIEQAVGWMNGRASGQ
ncbi:MAG: hypothetical protein AAF840_11340 [Bacteroidota bacterium]